MKKNKLGITKIDCEARGSYVYESGETHQVATVLTHDSNKEDAELRAKLISEAFNVANETGKAPRQLANENEMLLEALIDAKNQIWYLNEKFPETGTSNKVLAKILSTLDKIG